MTQQQAQMYTMLKNYIQNLPSGTQFVLDNNTYNKANLNPGKGDKTVIGRQFKHDVENNIIVYVAFDYIYCNCKRCGYKSNDNKAHYKKV